MPNSTTFKNILYHLPIHATGNVHIGDIYHINGQSKEIPLELTTLPFIAKSEVVGREADLGKVNQLLQTSDRVLLVNGIGGVGKTTLAKYYMNQFKKKSNH